MGGHAGVVGRPSPGEVTARTAARVRGVSRVVLPLLPFVAMAAFVATTAAMVPVRNLVEEPALVGSARRLHWPIAVAGLAAVLAVGTPIAVAALRARSRPVPAPVAVPDGPGTSRPALAFGPIGFHAVPFRAVATTAAVSSGVGLGALVDHQAAWVATSLALIPWVPLFVLEEVWAYRHDGFFAVFLGLAVLQTGHLLEHTAQVGQLIAFGGDLSRSHGVFGALDFELVHLLWDTAVWLGGALLVYRFPRSTWLWVSWVAASLHQVEHIYLFTVMRTDLASWAHGGVAGIMGRGGLIGSPLERPYLHFIYNFLVVIPMLFALWNEAARLRDRTSAEPRWSGRERADDGDP